MKINRSKVPGIAMTALPLAAASSAHSQIAVTDLGPTAGDFSADAVEGFSSLAVPLDFDGDGVEDLQIRTRQFDNLLKVIVDGDADNSQANNEEDEIIAFPGSLNPIALTAGDRIGPSPSEGAFVLASNDMGQLGDSNVWRAFTDPPATSSEGDFPVGGEERFIGVRTVIDGNTHFAWIGIVIDSETFSPDIGVNGYVSAIAYNTVPGEPITAGDRGDGVDCACDVNSDTRCTSADFFAWVNAFGAQAPECDVNGDTLCTSADFFAWVNAFGVGC